MVAEPSLRVKLYGTEAPMPEPRVLAAGPLSVELVGGALRYARYGGIEVLRGIDYLLRDASWGTVLPEISGLRVEETGDGFRVGYDARCVVGDEEVVAELEAHEVERVGQRIDLHVDMNRVVLIDPETDRVL